ncbi:hypothetical protein NM688_g3416 [Phlebia brevispora]|uniref:Uncharacterized protein n=1 Tax=Phlebia brevispora TaxID=194682 RepID=A0ACC1T613_9APHY|nr:hypothetical protein NM688_g3416 [Phlebia brevispora]
MPLFLPLGQISSSFFLHTEGAGTARSGSTLRRSSWLELSPSGLPLEPDADFLIACDILTHIGSWREKLSPWISTSLSFSYVAYEANRRENDYRHRRHKWFISVIDANHPLMERRCMAATDVLLLYTHPDDAYSSIYRSAQNFASMFKEILVYGQIPTGAVVATFAWKDIKAAFPQFAGVAVESGTPSKLRAYKNKVRNLAADQVPNPAVIVTKGFRLLEHLFDPTHTSTLDKLNTATKHTTDFCKSLLEWLDIGGPDVGDTVRSQPLYVSTLQVIQDAERTRQDAQRAHQEVERAGQEIERTRQESERIIHGIEETLDRIRESLQGVERALQRAVEAAQDPEAELDIMMQRLNASWDSYRDTRKTLREGATERGDNAAESVSTNRLKFIDALRDVWRCIDTTDGPGTGNRRIGDVDRVPQAGDQEGGPREADRTVDEICERLEARFRIEGP